MMRSGHHQQKCGRTKKYGAEQKFRLIMLSKNKHLMKYVLLLIIAFTSSANGAKRIKLITVTNPSSFHRHEVIAVSLNGLKALGDVNTLLLVRERKSQKIVLSQTIDQNGDKVMDDLVFEVELAAREKKEFTVE